MTETFETRAGAGMMFGRARWLAAIVLLVVASAAGFLTLQTRVHVLRKQRPALDADRYFGSLRPHLGETRRAGYFSDHPERDGDLGNMIAAQYALVPTAMRPDIPRALTEKLLGGYSVVLDYSNAAALDRDLRQFREACEGQVEMTVTRVSSGLCLVQTGQR